MPERSPHPAVIVFALLVAAVLAVRLSLEIARHHVDTLTTFEAGLAVFAVVFQTIWRFTRRRA